MVSDVVITAGALVVLSSSPNIDHCVANKNDDGLTYNNKRLIFSPSAIDSIMYRISTFDFDENGVEMQIEDISEKINNVLKDIGYSRHKVIKHWILEESISSHENDGILFITLKNQQKISYEDLLNIENKINSELQNILDNHANLQYIVIN